MACGARSITYERSYTDCIRPVLGHGGPLDVVREFHRPILMIFALILAFVLIMRGLNFARTALPAATAFEVVRPLRR